MNKFRYRMIQFMQGRRGPDQFTQFLFMTSALLFLISIFWWNGGITYYMGVALCLYGLFRAFSKNIPKREQENNWFLIQKYRVTGGKSFRQRMYERKHYAYFKCPGCGQKMRAPRGKGRIRVTCHNCNTEFHKEV